MTLLSVLAPGPPFSLIAPVGGPRDVPTALVGEWEDLSTDPDPDWAQWEDLSDEPDPAWAQWEDLSDEPDPGWALWEEL